MRSFWIAVAHLEPDIKHLEKEVFHFASFKNCRKCDRMLQDIHTHT